MLPILLSLAIAQSDQKNDPPSLYRAVVSKPNPDNGYESFLLAMDFLKDNRFRTLRANAENDKSKSILESRKALIQRFAYSLSTARSGLRKKVFNPQNIVEPSSGFPEIAWMPDMTLLFLAEASVRQAYGNPIGSQQSYFDAYEFNCAIQRSGPMEPYVGGIEPKKKVIADLVGNLPRYTLPELAQVEKWAQSRLAPADLIDSLAFEQLNIEGQLDNVVAGKWRNRNDQDSPLLQRLSTLKFGEREIARGKVEQDLKHALLLWFDMLKLPERDWRKPDFPDYSQYGAGFVQQINAQTELSVKALLAERAKLRMLIIACRLYEYRWSYERFPAKLLDAVDSSLAVDPLTGQPFVYESSVSGVRLSTNGSVYSGPVGLIENKKE